ncbi:MAG: AAA family ATPase [Myxococcales bacterium]|jgi:flagellar biosynthesis protein FlhG|nr:AAA family ATPase [Myxococcales bacterium]
MAITQRRIIAVAGSKGGVGASMVVANLGFFLAQIGKRVLLVDCHRDSAGLHAWLAIQRPEKGLDDLLSGQCSTASEAAAETRINGLYLLASSANPMRATHWRPEEVATLQQHLATIEADYIILDLPSGTRPAVLPLLWAADYPIIVSQATGDAIESAYHLMSAAWWHRAQRALAAIDTDDDTAGTLREAVMRNTQLRTPRATMAHIASHAESAEWLPKFEAELSAFRPLIIVNQTRIKEDEELAGAMRSAATRWLGLIPEVLGSIGWDDNVWLALRRSKQLLIDFTNTRASRDLEQIVRRLLQLQHREHASLPLPPPLDAQNLYEVLEVYPGASEEEIRRAFKQIRTWFAPDSIAVQGVCSEAERQHFQQLAEDAHALLVDRFRRREYDRTHFPDGFSALSERPYAAREPIGGAVLAARETLPEVVLRDDQFVDGAFLGRIRKEHNVELVDISNRAKISVAYLRAIEEERFNDLPAAVFTRGFVHEFARYLKIDPRRATNDFMAKYESFMEHRKSK